MGNKASEALLGTLHGATAAFLIDVIENGIPVYEENEEGERIEIRREPCTAAYLAQAIKLLKDNNITADSGTNRHLQDLMETLPDFSEDGEVIKMEDYK